MTKEIKKIIIIVLIAVFLIGITGRLVYVYKNDPKTFGRVDFSVFYAAASFATQHQDFYNHDTLGKYAVALRGVQASWRYLYSPMATIIFMPLLLFSFSEAAWIWFGLNLIFFMATLLLLFYLSESKHTLKIWAVILLLLFFFAPFYTNLNTGQVNIFIMLLFFLTFFFIKKKKILYAGLLTAIMIIIKTFPVFLLGYFLVRKKWKLFAYSVISVIAILLICWPYFGTDIYKKYFKKTVNLSSSGIYHDALGRLDNVSLSGYLHRLDFLSQQKNFWKNKETISKSLLLKNIDDYKVKKVSIWVSVVYYCIAGLLGLYLIWLTFWDKAPLNFVTASTWLSFTLFCAQDVHYAYLIMLFPVLVYWIMLYRTKKQKPYKMFFYGSLAAVVLICVGGKYFLPSIQNHYFVYFLPLAQIGNLLILLLGFKYLKKNKYA